MTPMASSKEKWAKNLVELFSGHFLSLSEVAPCVSPRVTRRVICILLSHNADNYPMLYFKIGK